MGIQTVLQLLKKYLPLADTWDFFKCETNILYAWLDFVNQFKPLPCPLCPLESV